MRLHIGSLMKLFNYLETLTPAQKNKLKDKKGTLLYYEWFERLYNNFDLETIGAMLLGAVFYDIHGGSKSIPGKLMKVINKNKMAILLFKVLLDRTYAGTKEWINRHNSNHNTNNRDKDETLNNSKPKSKKNNSDKTPEENEKIHVILGINPPETQEDVPF